MLTTQPAPWLLCPEVAVSIWVPAISVDVEQVDRVAGRRCRRSAACSGRPARGTAPGRRSSASATRWSPPSPRPSRRLVGAQRLGRVVRVAAGRPGGCGRGGAGRRRSASRGRGRRQPRCVAMPRGVGGCGGRRRGAHRGRRRVAGCPRPAAAEATAGVLCSAQPGRGSVAGRSRRGVGTGGDGLGATRARMRGWCRRSPEWWSTGGRCGLTGAGAPLAGRRWPRSLALVGRWHVVGGIADHRVAAGVLERPAGCSSGRCGSGR